MGQSGEYVWIFLLAGMTVLPILIGKGVLAVLYGKRESGQELADCLLTGWLAVIGLAEAAHLSAVFLRQSFSSAVWVFAAGVILLAAASGVFFLWKYIAGKGRKSRRRQKKTQKYPYSSLQIALFLAFVAMMVYRIVLIARMDAVYRTGDLTVETVQSFLETDSVYQVNPLTGRAYTEGIPLRIRILCLPTLYGAFCRIFGVAAPGMVCCVIPVAVAAGSGLAYYLLAKSLFTGDEDRDRYVREKKWIFLVIVATLLLAGDYFYSMDGFGLAYSGFRGETIRNVILLPYELSLILRRKWKSVILCILAEACIVWTLYGMGACLFVTAGMTAYELYRKKKKAAMVGEEVRL